MNYRQATSKDFRAGSIVRDYLESVESIVRDHVEIPRNGLRKIAVSFDSELFGSDKRLTIGELCERHESRENAKRQAESAKMAEKQAIADSIARRELYSESIDPKTNLPYGENGLPYADVDTDERRLNNQHIAFLRHFPHLFA